MSQPTELTAPDEMVGAWSIEIDVDPLWYELKGTLADQPCPQPSTALPTSVVLNDHTTLIGRQTAGSVAQGVEIARDRGVSRRHAQFVYDGEQLTVVDLSSTNGTYVIDVGRGPSASDQPLVPGVPVVLQAGDQVYLGAWTRLTVRATH